MSSPQAAAAPGSAKAALTCACRILASHGIQLEAETLRQAKFNTPTVSSAMFQAVHDLVLLNVLWSSGLHTDPDPAARLQAASNIWKEVQQEGTPGMTLDGLILVCYYLQQWGCPRQIVQDLEHAAAAAAAAAADSGEGHYTSSLDHEETDASRFVGSRLSLLALAWLLQRCRLFEAAVEALHPGGPARALLPPLPPDSCLCEATQQSYLGALQRGQAHSQKVLQLLQQRPPQRPHLTDEPEQAWPLVELAAHSAIMLLGKARSSLSSLQSLLDARLKLQQALRQAQPGVGSALSPLELHLLLNKQAMQAHLQALGSAAAALEQQQELATCARLFFSWMASVVAEEAKGRGVALGDSPAAGPAAGLAMLESLQRLPEVGSHVAASLLQHLDQQLQEAVEATQPWLSTCRTSERLSVYQTSNQPKQAKGGDRDKVEDVNLAHFQRLASQALAAGAAGAAAAGSHPANARAEGSHAASCLPAADWSLPSDLSESLQHLRRLQGGGAAAGRGSGRQELSDLVHASACLKHEIPRAEDGVAQSRAHHPGDLSRGSGEPQPDHVIQGADETDRLLRSTLQCGKALAQTRAANKQAMLLGLAQLPSELRLHWPC